MIQPINTPQTTKIKELFFKRKLVQSTVAKELKIDNAQMSLIVNGRVNMRMDTVKMMCEYLQCSPNDILEWEGWVEKAKEKARKKNNNSTKK
jgi:DNA-binding Xre family transcriptional regulator